MEIKYTSDGKKVIIIGSFNSQEKIVQEIFVVDGSEIPSGEHFVVKSLHDAPAVSWKEKTLKEMEARYEKLRAEYEQTTNDLQRKLNDQTKLLTKKLHQLSCIETSPYLEKGLGRVVDFISGQMTHVVMDSYDGVQVEEFDKVIAYVDSSYRERRVEDIKLCTVYGKCDGNLLFYINSYSDGSGGRNEIHPFNSREAALEKAKDMVLQKFSKSPSESLIRNAETLGIELPKNEIALYYEKVNEGIVSRIDGLAKDMETAKSKLIPEKTIKALKK